MAGKIYDSMSDAKKDATAKTNKTGMIHFINFADGEKDKYIVIPSDLGVGGVTKKSKGGRIKSAHNRLY
jgi:hypothetical protein